MCLCAYAYTSHLCHACTYVCIYVFHVYITRSRDSHAICMYARTYVCVYVFHVYVSRTKPTRNIYIGSLCPCGPSSSENIHTNIHAYTHTFQVGLSCLCRPSSSKYMHTYIHTHTHFRLGDHVSVGHYPRTCIHTYTHTHTYTFQIG